MSNHQISPQKLKNETFQKPVSESAPITILSFHFSPPFSSPLQMLFPSLSFLKIQERAREQRKKAKQSKQGSPKTSMKPCTPALASTTTLTLETARSAFYTGPGGVVTSALRHFRRGACPAGWAWPGSAQARWEPSRAFDYIWSKLGGEVRAGPRFRLGSVSRASARSWAEPFAAPPPLPLSPGPGGSGWAGLCTHRSEALWGRKQRGDDAVRDQ